MEFLPDYPDVKVEIVIDYGLTGIVRQHAPAFALLVEALRYRGTPRAGQKS